MYGNMEYRNIVHLLSSYNMKKQSPFVLILVIFYIYCMVQPTYQELLNERDTLRKRIRELEEENTRLRKRLGEEKNIIQKPSVMSTLSLQEKVDLFRRLFKGREDVFARRWYSRTSGKSGYQPVCENEWNPQLCDKKSLKCSDCPNRKFSPLKYDDYFRHLSGKDEYGRDVIGIYVILEDNTCNFLCADFDDKNCEHGYKNDVLAYVSVCDEWNIPYSIERSRSGLGAHVWIFFENPVAAAKARKLGNTILTEAMNRDGRISFKSYDRFFPNQDYLLEGGFGNLVALPLQGKSRKKGNSVFVDKNFDEHPDQWDYLLHVNTFSEKGLEELLDTHSNTSPMGEFSKTNESEPWKVPIADKIKKEDFCGCINIIRSNQLYFHLKELTPKVLNHLKRIASFKNPEFYSRQALRFSTHSTPRIISCADINDEYLALPRGCEDAIHDFLRENNVECLWTDETNHGCHISTTFNGGLRDEQAEAVEALSSERTGILSATTAFGKTVAAIGLIAKLQVNTLVLVHTKALLDQWKNELEKFLTIDFTPEETNQNRGRKKKSSPIGTLCSSGDSLHGLVDVVIMQSCFNNKEVKSFVRNYGMVIVDECHHVSAVSFEQILKNVIANHVYGLTATPIRKDGQQPIIFMQCGPVRYTADAKYQMKSQTFQRLLVLRFTSFRMIDEHNPAYTKVMPLLSKDQYRNEVIINDVRAVLEAKRSPIILTSLTEHVNILADMLRPYCKNVVTLIGSASTKEKRQNMERLNSIPAEEPFVIVATGKYVGEGFDYPRLDTLFMALPVSWKGIVAQYAGRLHREYNGKNEVEIYDYIDIHIPVCESMYRKRMKGYAAIGYSIKTEDALFRETINTSQVILDGKTFVRPFISSISKARKSILLSCPKIKMGKYSLIAERLRDIALNGITIIIFTETENEDIRKLQSYGFHVIIKPKNNFNCAIIDNTQIWYGSVNLLGYHSEEDNIITFNDAKVATEIINTLSP